MRMPYGFTAARMDGDDWNPAASTIQSRLGAVPFGEGQRRTGERTVQRFVRRVDEFGDLGRLLLCGVVLLLLVPAAQAAATSAAVTGVVQDAQGVAQMGALVQLLASDASPVGTAFTDLHGHYLIRGIRPGTYQVRASATLFVPTTRGNLQLRTGARTVVNLTLATLFDTTSWLPAERRRSDEPADDWRWTLRSSANRPILRVLGDGTLVLASAETPTPRMQGARVAVSGGNGGFGYGGVHTVVSAARMRKDGADILLRADIGSPGFQSGGFASNEMALGYERPIGLAGSARTVLSYRAHPEVIAPDGSRGVTLMEMGGSQQSSIGDFLDLEFGGSVRGIHTATGDGFSSSPFVRLTAHPAGTWTLRYRMATSKDLQSAEDLSPQGELPALAVLPTGKVLLEKGRHQEIAISHGAGPGVIQVSVYHDVLDRMAVNGLANSLQLGGVPTGGFMLDQISGSFRALRSGYAGNGLQIQASTPLPSGIRATVEYSTGRALGADFRATTSVQSAMSNLTARGGQTAAVSLKGRIKGTGTSLRTMYRFQPSRLVTAVNPYAAFSDQGFLSLSVKQPLRWGNRLPVGLEATIDVTNLLAQGYRPFLSADGQTLYFAQAPRTMQAGLSFSF